MSLDSAIQRFRSRQLDLFRSTCTVARTAEPTFDSSTGTLTPGATTTVYSGACLIRPRNAREVQAGEQEIELVGYVGKFPVDSGIETDDVVTVTASDHDASMVGKSFRVTDAPADDWQISRKVSLEEVVT